MNQRYKGLTLAGVGACFWGASGTAVEFLFSSTNVNTAWLVGLRLLFSGALLMIYACWKYLDQVKAMLHDKKVIIMLIIFAFLGMGELTIIVLCSSQVQQCSDSDGDSIFSASFHNYIFFIEK